MAALSGGDIRAALLAVLVEAEVISTTTGNHDIAVVAHDAVTRLLEGMPVGDPTTDTAREAHAAVGKLLAAVARR